MKRFNLKAILATEAIIFAITASGISVFACPVHCEIDEALLVRECIQQLINEKKQNIIDDIFYKFKEYHNPTVTENSTEITTSYTTETSTETTTNTVNLYSEFVYKVLELTNNERIKCNIAPLKMEDTLCKAAQEHASDMAVNNYFSHTSLDGRTIVDRINKYAKYKCYGENIAMGQITPEQVVKDWINSEGHRANILNSQFTKIGIGYNKNGNYWVQNFGG